MPEIMDDPSLEKEEQSKNTVYRAIKPTFGCKRGNCFFISEGKAYRKLQR